MSKSISSIDKILYYLNCISKDDHVIVRGDKVYEFTEKIEFRIRPSMFHRDYCTNCGQCCRNYDTVFFPFDLSELEKRKDNDAFAEYLDMMTESTVSIDGREHKFLTVRPMTPKHSHDIWVSSHATLNCRWIKLEGGKKYCRMHEYRGVTCGFPHMELYQNCPLDRGFLGHRQFGRNLAIKCPVDVKQPLDRETLDENVYWLGRLNQVAEYFEIDTYIPEVMEFLKTVDPQNPPQDTISFFKKKKKLFEL